MSTAQFRRVEEIFHEAAAIPSLDERHRFVAAICDSDAEMRRAVELLLASHGEVQERAGPEFPRFGAYRATRVIGRGGMGVVWEAERTDGEFDLKVAVKLLSDWSVSAAAREHFRRERQILARLEHPGIARLLDGGVTDDGSPYLVMEYVDGEHIDVHCDRHGLGAEERKRLFFEVLAALEYAHSQRVAHRDVKPSNIMVDRQGRVRLLDFGTARLLARPGESAAGQTVLRGVTPGFSSPEMMAGEPVDERTDVYSLGVLYEKLLGAAADKRVAARACAAKRGDRYATVGALRNAVVTAERSAWRRWAAGLAVALVLVVTAAWWWTHRAQPMKQVSAAGENWQDLSVAAASDWIAFSSDRAVPGEYDVWISRQDGSDLQAVTRDAARDREPAISPDGRWVVFVSERDSQGLYEFDRLTKQTRRLASGRRPAFSPDGKWLLLARVDDRSDLGWAGTGVWQVMPARGGAARALGGTLAEVLSAVWSPDSSAVYLQAEALGVARAGTVWRQEVNAANPSPWVRIAPGWRLCALGYEGTAYFHSLTGTSVNSGEWPRASWPAQSELPMAPLAAAPGGLVTGCGAAGTAAFAQVAPELAKRFELSMNWPAGRAQGEPKVLPAPEGWRHHLSASADGRVRTYQTEGGPMRLGLRAEENGAPIWALALAGEGSVSKSGEAFWFTGQLARGGKTVWARKDQPDSARPHPNEGLIWDTAFDGSFALAYRTASRPAEIAWLSKDGATETVLAHPTWNLYRAALSWDQSWVAFTAVKEDGKALMYAAPFRGQERIPFREWVVLGRGGSQIWSPDDNRIVFLSRRDGHACLYQQPLDPVSKRPSGEAEVVAHLHGRDTVGNLPEDTFRISATTQGLIFSLGRREDRVVRLR